MTSVTIRRMPSSKYARVEVERRFLLGGVPEGAEVLAVDEIDDRYLDGTRLRLRRMAQVGGPTQLKLTQKVPDADGRGRQERDHDPVPLEAEHAALARMPGAALTKSRLSIAPYGIDVFHGALAGLFLGRGRVRLGRGRPRRWCPPGSVAPRSRPTGASPAASSCAPAGAQVRAWTRETASRSARR